VAQEKLNRAVMLILFIGIDGDDGDAEFLAPPLDDLNVARMMEEMAAAVCCGSVAWACDDDAIPKQRTSAIKHGIDSQRGKLTGDRCSGGVDMRPLEAKIENLHRIWLLSLCSSWVLFWMKD
jgi:hypothetical protein